MATRDRPKKGSKRRIISAAFLFVYFQADGSVFFFLGISMEQYGNLNLSIKVEGRHAARSEKAEEKLLN